MAMKLKLQHLMDATMALRGIIDRNDPMPQKGKYRVARMYDKLEREFQIINKRRNEMITAYNTPQMILNPAWKPDGSVSPDVPQFISSPTEFMVPPDKLPEFTQAWEEIGKEEIEVDVQPIPLEQLCLADPKVDGGIAANELIVLGDLVAE